MLGICLALRRRLTCRPVSEDHLSLCPPASRRAPPVGRFLLGVDQEFGERPRVGLLVELADSLGVGESGRRWRWRSSALAAAGPVPGRAGSSPTITRRLNPRGSSADRVGGQVREERHEPDPGPANPEPLRASVAVLPRSSSLRVSTSARASSVVTTRGIRRVPSRAAPRRSKSWACAGRRSIA
jgi:hypothetical protein